MNPNYLITLKEVGIYQELYYQHYKPLMLKFSDEYVVKEKMSSILESLGWTWRIFMDYKYIDLFQRLVFEHSYLVDILNPMTSNEEYKNYDPNYGALRLKNSLLSDDKDFFN